MLGYRVGVGGGGGGYGCHMVMGEMILLYCSVIDI